MRAFVLRASQDVALEKRDKPLDIPFGHARVRNIAIALNHLDLFGYRGMAFAKRQLPMIVGTEASCIVDAVGEGVDESWVGKLAVVYPGLVCGRCNACRVGDDTLCDDAGGIMGFHVDGFAADYSVVPADLLIALPKNVSPVDAACATVTYGTVERMLFSKAKLVAGETILIHAGGSGIGSAAVALAKSVGARVIATVGSEAKIKPALAIGADHVINYSEISFERGVNTLTSGRGVDVVFEHVGKDTWERSLRCLVKGGRLVTCGSTTGIYGRTNLMHLYNQQITIHAMFGANRRDIRTSLNRFSAGEIRPVIDSVLKPENIVVGLQRLRERQVFGKIIVDFGLELAA